MFSSTTPSILKVNASERIEFLTYIWTSTNMKPEYQQAIAIFKFGARQLLTDTEAEALMLFKNSTARDSQFWRWDCGGIPSTRYYL